MITPDYTQWELNCFIRIEPMRDITIVNVQGEIDAANVSQLHTALQSALSAATARGILLSLGSVTYADTATIHALFQFVEAAARRKRIIAITKPNYRAADKLFAYARLSQIAPLFADIDDAWLFLSSRIQPVDKGA